MPTMMRIGPHRFHFYSREGMEAKFWLRPVAFAADQGFATAELVRIQRLVEENCQTLVAA